MTVLGGRKLDPESSDERRYLLGLLPPAGWRVIDTRSPSEQGLAGVALAAPHSERPGGWALIYLSGRDDWWQFSADPGPEYPRPGRAARRHYLRLDWPVTPVVAPPGQPLALSVRLTNTANTAWSNGPDLVRVLAWVLDPGTGDPLPAEKWFTSSGSDHRPVELAPGESMLIPAIIATYEPVRLLPGRYGLTALLTSLNLRSAPGALHLT